MFSSNTFSKKATMMIKVFHANLTLVAMGHLCSSISTTFTAIEFALFDELFLSYFGSIFDAGVHKEGEEVGDVEENEDCDIHKHYPHSTVLVVLVVRDRLLS